MDFPAFTEAAPLTALEIEALRSLYTTLQDLRHEYESARALSHRFYRLEETAQVYTHGRALTHHPDALHRLGILSDRYERGVGMLAWRHASAATVLGISILDRLVGGRPAMTAAAITALCEEPTLGRLREALSIPCTDLLVAREPDFRDRYEDARRGLLRSVEGVVENAAQIGDGVPEDAAELWAGRLSQFDRLDTDPLYDGILGPLLPFADHFPNEVDWYLRQSRKGALPQPI
ncbi:hypothetical protein [Streptomyces monashensis]|uniref:Uncharacterized protein n=1 Tax=Streptomyces monashensis TaxID=1678012 RepID=A0A1S2QRP4_9ACTN|nr:hypothetical protein [Streptomyces monashensis]OIK08233.1 hypothetical protein BIV23_00370 [Streptomyces monashensis]